MYPLACSNGTAATLPPPAGDLSRRIQHAAETRLRSSAYAALRCITCEYHEGVLTLRGRLPKHYLKQVAQTVVKDLQGVEQVVNRIVIVPSARRLGAAGLEKDQHLYRR